MSSQRANRAGRPRIEGPARDLYVKSRKLQVTLSPAEYAGVEQRAHPGRMAGWVRDLIVRELAKESASAA